jgi:hypothetical protein
MERTSNHQKSERKSIMNKQNSEKESSGIERARNTSKQSVNNTKQRFQSLKPGTIEYENRFERISTGRNSR